MQEAYCALRQEQLVVAQDTYQGEYDQPDQETWTGEADSVNWWLVLDDKADGPHTHADIALLLEQGSINATTLICADGEDTWEFLGIRWEFAAYFDPFAAHFGPPEFDDTRVVSWWLNLDDRPAVPRTGADIILLLEDGSIDSTTLVCPVGGDRWEPLADRPEFVPHVDAQRPVPSPLVPQITIDGTPSQYLPKLTTCRFT